MTIDDEPGWDSSTRWWAKDVDKKLDGVLVVVNASDEATTQTVSSLAGHKLALSPVQAKGSDPVVKGTTWDKATGTVTVPPRTVAVLVENHSTLGPRPRLVGLGPELVGRAPQLTTSPTGP